MIRNFTEWTRDDQVKHGRMLVVLWDLGLDKYGDISKEGQATAEEIVPGIGVKGMQKHWHGTRIELDW